MQERLKKLTLTAMFTAMIFVLTRFVQIPVAMGYVHLGDALIYVCAVLLGNPWAVIAGSVGQALADVSSGYIMYAPATFIIKALMAVVFSFAGANSSKILTKKTVIATIPCMLITFVGYFITDLIIGEGYAVANILGNITQGVASGIVFILLALALDKSKIKTRI